MYDDKIDDWKIYFIINWLKILVTNLHEHVDFWINQIAMKNINIIQYNVLLL